MRILVRSERWRNLKSGDPHVDLFPVFYLTSVDQRDPKIFGFLKSAVAKSSQGIPEVLPVANLLCFGVEVCVGSVGFPIFNGLQVPVDRPFRSSYRQEGRLPLPVQQCDYDTDTG